ncbi:hypothetical protein [Stutzerimonas nitrititolerans]|uniref:hypothetical protein n=1 Tax=Stutzerimonas nitrititolerans TaxID=2482751 RepID=UPI0028AA14F6|nr:hypothetical protein [Stutzerimonas nitrititolerans]
MKEYRSRKFMGKEIKCDSKYPCVEKQLEELYVLSNLSDTIFKCPLGFHIRIRLTDKTSMAKFSAMLSKYYRKYGYVPLRYAVKEVDQTGVHYHIAIVIEGRKNKRSSLSNFLGKLQKSGHLHDYKVIAPDGIPFGQPLRGQEHKDEYFKWMSYLAKTRSKEIGKQSSSPCKRLVSLIKSWRSQGKPDLSSNERVGPKDLTVHMEDNSGLGKSAVSDIIFIQNSENVVRHLAGCTQRAL